MIISAFVIKLSELIFNSILHSALTTVWRLHLGGKYIQMMLVSFVRYEGFECFSLRVCACHYVIS